MNTNESDDRPSVERGGVATSRDLNALDSNIVGRDQINLHFVFDSGPTTEQMLMDLRLSREQLLEALIDYERFLGTYTYGEGDRQWHAGIIGHARAACLRVNDAPSVTDIPLQQDLPQTFRYHSIDDLPPVSESAGENVHVIHRLHFIADKRLTPYFVTENSEGLSEDDREGLRLWGPYLSRNRDALRHAIERVVQLIEQSGSNAGTS